MAIAIRFDSTCDACASQDVETHDAETYEFPALMGAPAFVVELCPKDYEIMRDHWAGYASLGRAPERGARRTTATATAKRSGPAPVHDGGAAVCPKCGHVATTAPALRNHARAEHGTSLAGIGFYPANFKCDTCGEGYPNRQGLAAHARTAHKKAS